MSNMSVLMSGQSLVPTDPTAPGAINYGLVSVNKSYQLQYQNDGNLVFYKLDGHTPLESAATNRAITPQSYAMMDSNGRFVLIDVPAHGDPTTYWQSDAQGPAGCNLYLDNDGVLFFAMQESGERTILNVSQGQVI